MTFESKKIELIEADVTKFKYKIDKRFDVGVCTFFLCGHWHNIFHKTHKKEMKMP